MHTNDDKLLSKGEVFQIVGCAIEVLNTLGHGIVEKPYENAPIVEFRLREIPFRQPRRLSGSSTQKSSTESQATNVD
jgi:GxxExxY protein